LTTSWHVSGRPRTPVVEAHAYRPLDAAPVQLSHIHGCSRRDPALDSFTLPFSRLQFDEERFERSASAMAFAKLVASRSRLIGGCWRK